jgi:cytochrome c peroxidase
LPAGSGAIVQRSSGGFIIANPLLDAFVLLSEGGATDIVRIEPQPDDNRRRDLRLGEALFFTNLMAPNNPTDGAHSSFSCETCHFEGYVDGRVHHTGRDDVRVVTKPLLGLFNNRPHFSRALDPDLSSVAHAEFRVAGAGSDHSPWFVLEPAAHPTLAAFNPSLASSLSPLDLRLALMTFLMDFSHRTNPAIEGRTTFTPFEREGAELFRHRCESCHEARTSTDEPQSRVPFDRWESLVFSPSGPIVWAQSDYRKTGVEPYVHELGARVPSLRRLYKKRPYLTSGVAQDLEQVLGRLGWTDDGTFFHDRAPQGAQRFGSNEEYAIRAFLELL